MASTEKPDDVADKSTEQAQTPAHNVDGGETTTTTTTTTTAPAPAATTAEAKPNPVEEENESDWEDLDDVLDDFDKPKQPATGKQPAKSKAANSDEDDLLEQFEAEMMAKLMGGAAGNNNSSNNNKSNDKGLEADMMAKLLAGLAGNDDNDNGSEADMMKKLIAGLAGNNDNDNGNDNKNTDDDKPSLVPHLTTRPPGPGPKKEIDDLEKYFDQSGIDPLDFMKALINETTEEGPSKANQPTPAATAAVQELLENDRAKQGTFQDTVQQTLERMRESGEKATAAATEDGDNTNDLFEQVLKAIDVNPGAGGDMDINKMFMSMMEQLSNKEMLYEPMKELHTKFGPWLQENRDKVAADELERYETQARLVGEIVSKFDEPDFSDDKPECRSYIWDRMQAMQAAGSPPDDLIANPLLDELSAGDDGGPNGPMPGECPQQ